MALGHDLDHLERHIDWYGSVVARVPDVWGQARLTEHREQFEEAMKEDLKTFEVGLQGSLARSDQAFFAHATALSFAAQPKPPVIGRVSSTKTPPVLVPTSMDVTKDSGFTANTADAGKAGINSSGKTTTVTKYTVPPEPETPKAPDPVKAAANPDLTKELTDIKDAIKRNDAKLERIGFEKYKADGITIEPTLRLAQKKRYLDYLNELRRENEGDDTADSPGYALNLVRIPVSLLPGKRTDVGHGAEITMTLTPVLGDDLLPMTFRNLVANDLRHQLGLPFAQFLNDDKEAESFLKDETRKAIMGLPVFQRINAAARQSAQAAKDEVMRLSDEEKKRAKDVEPYLAAEQRVDYHKLLYPEQEAQELLAVINAVATPPNPISAERVKMLVDTQPKRIKNAELLLGAYNQYDNFRSLLGVEDKAQDPAQVANAKKALKAVADDTEFQKKVNDSVRIEAAKGFSNLTPFSSGNPLGGTAEGKRILNFSLKFTTPPMSFSPGLVNKTGFPTSQLFEVYGLSNCFQILYAAHAALHDSIVRQKYAHLPDIQGFLQHETIAAYRFLADPHAAQLWANFCTPDVVTAVRLRRADHLEVLREQYRTQVRHLTTGSKEWRDARPHLEAGEYSTTAALAWCILVDSALLTDKLVRDMTETAAAKRAHIPNCGAWLDYYHPHPSPEARQTFAAYVNLRWPVRVFALDPSVQEQNIADALSTRRETQLALAIAFTNGFINANTLTRYARRLEAEYETIALNRTQVGFGHGENVFGWRFYPRFQTPDTEGNLTVLFRDQLIGGPNRNQLLRQRRLEPGPRECVALVMMPSFVPYVTLDTVGNWFGLANPKHKVLDHTQALKMSRTVQTLKTCGPNVTDAACYRTGEFERMLRRVEQLEARLPSQTVHFPVPVMNTLGGFEMFSNGTTDLAPELYGWYGAPGVSAKTTTTLFLVGDHFSPLHTKVIVGNKPVGNPKMLSRQVIQLEVPADAVQLGDQRVSAHLATPYGVTRELLIPVVGSPAPAPAPGFTFGDQKLVAKYAITRDPVPPHDPNIYLPAALGSGTDKLSIRWVAPGGTLTSQVAVRFEFPFATGDTKVMLQSTAVGTVTKGTVEIDKAALDGVACDLVNQIVRVSPRLPRDPNPLATPLVSAKVTITPAPPPGGNSQVAQSVETNDSIRLEFAPSVGPVQEIPPHANGHPPMPAPGAQRLHMPQAETPRPPGAPPASVPPKKE